MVRTLEFVEKLNDNLLGTICDYALRLAEAKDRAIAAEEELAIQSWRAEENLRCCESRDKRIALLEIDVRLLSNVAAAAENGCQYHEKRANTAEQKAQDMEYRAQNAEVNAKYYWKEMERLKKELAEKNKAPNLWYTTNGTDWTLVAAGSADAGIGG